MSNRQRGVADDEGDTRSARRGIRQLRRRADRVILGGAAGVYAGLAAFLADHAAFLPAGSPILFLLVVVSGGVFTFRLAGDLRPGWEAVGVAVPVGIGVVALANALPVAFGVYHPDAVADALFLLLARGLIDGLFAFGVAYLAGFGLAAAVDGLS